MTTRTDIPPLEPWCGSWVVTRRATGAVVGEFFTRDRALVEQFNPATTCVETAQQYLARINRAIKERPMASGKTCPEGKVQVEVNVDLDTPTDSALVEIYVGGRRFIILAGGAARQWGLTEPGLLIQTETSVQAVPSAMNSVAVTLDTLGESIHPEDETVEQIARTCRLIRWRAEK